uniref:Disease resistance RPP13-like protein 1 n=1 Tax=Ananas comosus var. bracteatus TaxID=296719 RepID=A0A6V7PDV7_ANACO|nr:unnamed protein product [Ananas comosus var. bracteatus]
MRKKIVEKLSGSPLAAKTLGRLCNSKLEKNNWKDFLKTEIWQMQQNDSDIMPVLKLTYHHLPAHLKQCFCLLFCISKEYDFDKEDLVRMWMGQGFIQSGDMKGVEDLGNEYFDHLIAMGIFLRKQDRYVMPPLMNDLARFVSMDECSGIESSGEAWGLSGTPRHFSLIFHGLNQSKHTNLMNLKGLRTLMFLDASETVSAYTLNKSLTSKIESIGRLSLLQELEEFKVCKNRRISELKEMNELRGCLSIGDLHNVESSIEAGEAMLANKCHLEMLKLEWPERKASSVDTSRDLEVLKNFQPPSSLRKLKITRYGGIFTPKWMKDKMPSRLEVVCLYDCPNWQQLPSLGGLRFLKTLKVRGMPGVSTFSHDFYGGSKTVKFPSLRVLRFFNMPEWKDWLVGEDDQYSFPCLDELVLEKCTNLRQCLLFPPH